MIDQGDNELAPLAVAPRLKLGGAHSKAACVVSIIIPVKNSRSTLGSTLSSIGGQTYKNIEVIVADNLSDDGTKERLEELAAKVGFPIKILRREFKNTPDARVSGAKLAKGIYIFHVDSDMELNEKVVGECVQKIQEGCGSVIIPERSFGKGYWSACKCLERSCYDNDDDIESARFFPAEVYFEVGGHNADVLFAEDKDLDLRVRKAGYRVGRIQARIQHNEGRIRLFNQLKKKYKYGKTGFQYLKKHPGNLIKQSFFLRPAFIRNWRLLAASPHLTAGMLFMKFSELSALGISSIINSVIPNKKP